MILLLVLGGLTFVTIAVASMCVLLIARRESMSHSERYSAVLGASFSLLFFCLVGYLFLMGSWELRL